MLVGIWGCRDSKNKEALSVAFDNSPRTFDSRFALDANSQYLSNLIDCSIIEYKPDGGYQNQVAEKIQWRNENELYIKIKKDLYFFGEKPLTAYDIKATYDFFLSPEKKSPKSSAFENIYQIKVISPSELVFFFKKIDASFVVNNLSMGILPEKLAGRDHIKDVKKFQGCGPYDLISFTSLEVKLRHKKTGRNLYLKIVKDEGTRFLKLQKGEIDLTQNLNREKVARIKDYPQLKVQKRTGLNTAYLAFNMRDEITGNQKVREAISYGIDRDKIIKYALSGMATKAQSLLLKSSPYFSKPQKKREFNPEKAKKLLDEAGYPDPDGDGPKMRFTLHYKTTTDRTRVTIAKELVTQLSKIGIDVKLQTLEWGKFKKDIEEGRAQIWTLKWVGFKDPDIYHYIFHSSQIPPQGGNRGFYENPQLDTLLVMGRESSSEKKRREIYARVQEMINRDLPYINLWHEDVFAAMKKEIMGYEVYGDGRYQALSRVKISEGE